MKRTSKEFHELQEQFEKDVYKMPFYVGAEAIRTNESGLFYKNGTLNDLFYCYMSGYQLAKCKARFGNLPLNE